jgi:hypothetical protein
MAETASLVGSLFKKAFLNPGEGFQIEFRPAEGPIRVLDPRLCQEGWVDGRFLQLQ